MRRRIDPSWRRGRTVQPPDHAPPAKVLSWLRLQGFEEIVFRAGEHPLWRRNGMIYAWDEIPHAVTSEMAAELDKLRAENVKLASVTPRRGIFTSEFLLNAGGVIAVAVTASQGQISELAAHLGPTGAAVVNIAVAVIIAAAGGTYAANRKIAKELESEAKKQIVATKE
jgi:hypothetical protein